MAKFVKGDVVVVPFPFSDLSQSKRRPALVIASLEGNDAILCQITSQTIKDTYAIPIDDTDFSSGSLRQPGNIRPNRLVNRHGEALCPTDYFSQSQQQTLLLGLFLTACSSQTWSAFSPVFLDDPLTHFDDLNTYAFLDLIVGLLESDFGKRQFVISTCDEKLLKLARQKFRYLSERAKFYRFSAIGADGPIIDEIALP